MAQDSEGSHSKKRECFRDTTHYDMKQKCYDLCKDYLGGVWLKLSIDEIEVKRLSGSYTNQLYHCAISKPLVVDGDQPQEVVIRLYGKKLFNNYDCDGNERLTDVIIALLVSENKLGPKIYGLFESGQIQHFYPHIQFGVDEQNDTNLVEELARKLARVHAMDVPIYKTGNWLFQTYDAFYDMANKRFNLKELIDEYNCETLSKHDLKQEIEWLKSCILQINSPLCFSHNDFRGNNIMVRKVTDNSESADRLVFCDFEYSSYAFRGVDFGTIFAEWGKSWFDFKKLHDFPSDSLIKSFISIYIDECVQINGKEYSINKINSVQQILKEVKVFSLASNMFLVTLIIKSDKSIDDSPFDRKQSMLFSEMCYKNYHHLKQKFIEEKVF